MGENFWFKFEWAKYQGDSERRRCSLATRGFWDELFVEMEKTNTYFLQGSIREISNIAVCSVAETNRSIAELVKTNTAKIVKTKDGVKIVSRRLLKKHNLREYNRIKQQEHRDKERVKKLSIENSNLESKSLREEREYKKEKKEIGEEQTAIAYDDPVEELMAAFPDLTLTPGQIGLIVSMVMPTAIDRQAWTETVEKYQANHDPATKTYMPNKIGNVLDVFRDRRTKLLREKHGNGNARTEREKSAERGANTRDAITELRRLGEEKRRGAG